MPRSQSAVAVATERRGSISLRVIGAASMWRPHDWILPTLVVFILSAIMLSGVLPRHAAQTRIVSQAQDVLDQARVAREMRVARSLDMARRVVAALRLPGREEFGPLASGMSPRDGGLVTGRSLANGVDAAKPLIEAAADAGDVDAGDVDGRVIERAAPPKEPSSPKVMPLLVIVTLATLFAAAVYVAFSDIIARVSTPPRFATPRSPERPSTRRAPNQRWRREPSAEDVVIPPSPPRAPAGRIASMAGYIAGFGRAASASRDAASPEPTMHDAPLRAATLVGWDEPVAAPSAAPAAERPVVPPGESTAPAEPRHDVVARIVADHVPGRGLHVVGTGIGAEDRACSALVTLARGLAEKGRSVIVDLNATPARLAILSLEGRVAMLTLDGLSELLAGEASFAEVIHRDHASRLHFIPTGRKEADFRDFDLILDALTETYDFIVLLTPAFPHSEIAKVMAPYADIMVLIATDDADAAMVAMLEHDLVAAGAREVLVSGTHASAGPDKVVA